MSNRSIETFMRRIPPLAATVGPAIMFGAIALHQYTHPAQALTPTETTRPIQEPPKPPLAIAPSPTAEKQLTDEQIILKTARTLGIKENPSEINAWSIAHFPMPNHPLNGPETLTEGSKRLDIIFPLMKNSEIEQLSVAGNFLISRLGLGGNVNINLRNDLTGNNGKPIFSSFSSIPTGNTFFHKFEFNLNNIIPNYTLDPFIVALESTKAIAYVLDVEKGITDTLTISSHATAVEIRAFIEAYGAGYRPEPGSVKLKHAAMFIKLGNDSNSLAWRNYVRTEILGERKNNNNL